MAAYQPAEETSAAENAMRRLIRKPRDGENSIIESVISVSGNGGVAKKTAMAKSPGNKIAGVMAAAVAAKMAAQSKRNAIAVGLAKISA
jgi:hypothetical protein